MDEDLQAEIKRLKAIIAEKDKKIIELHDQIRREQTLNEVLREQMYEEREHDLEYSNERYNIGFEHGIHEERKKRNAGRKKNPFLEEEYLATAEEIQRLLDMGHTMKEIIENGMITKVNPKTKQIEPVSRSTIYRCMKLYKSSTK